MVQQFFLHRGSAIKSCEKSRYRLPEVFCVKGKKPQRGGGGTYNIRGLSLNIVIVNSFMICLMSRNDIFKYNYPAVSYIHLYSVREAAKNGLFLVARPGGGGGKGLATKKKIPFLKL